MKYFISLQRCGYAESYYTIDRAIALKYSRANLGKVNKVVGFTLDLLSEIRPVVGTQRVAKYLHKTKCIKHTSEAISQARTHSTRKAVARSGQFMSVASNSQSRKVGRVEAALRRGLGCIQFVEHGWASGQRAQLIAARARVRWAVAAAMRSSMGAHFAHMPSEVGYAGRKSRKKQEQ